MFARLDNSALILKVKNVQLPATNAKLHTFDLQASGLKKSDWALASLAMLAHLELALNMQMLQAALNVKLSGPALQNALAVLDQVTNQLYE